MTIPKMKAPSGVHTANINGHEYKVSKDGLITVVSGTHVDTLKLHGFRDHHEEPVDIADQIAGMDDKDSLVEFIEERGGEADNSMTLKRLRRLAISAAGLED